jgi:hypothetical protein
MLNQEMLLDSGRFIRKDAAHGVDQVSAVEYEQNLEENINNLVERVMRGSYHAKRLNRRSQHQSYNWRGFTVLLEHCRVEKPRITWPSGMQQSAA